MEDPTVTFAPRPARDPSRIGALRRWRPSLRGGVLGGSAVLVFLMAVGIAISVSNHLRETATDSAVGNADAIVRGYVDPIVSEQSLALTAGPDAEIEAQLGRLVASGDMRRINLWTRDGRILYSTDSTLRGRRLDVTSEVARAFGGESFGEYRSVSAGTDPALPERYLEIFVPMRGSSDANPIGVFEVTIDARPIEQRVDNTRRDVFLIALGAGATLLALLLAWLPWRIATNAPPEPQPDTLNEQLNAMTIDLRQSEARFRSLVQNSSDVVAVIDRRRAGRLPERCPPARARSRS